MLKTHNPITPGEILRSEFLEPLGITTDGLAQATGIPRTRMSEIIRGKRRITAGTALRLSRALGLSDRFWLTIQDDYDIEREHNKHAGELERVERLTRG
jgi:addiction module HigA family antidote